MKLAPNSYKKLLQSIGNTIETARQNTIRNINQELVKANWEIGRHIVEFEQNGKERAEYGSDLLSRLSRDLKLSFGKGFGRRNVLDMRRFYLCYQKWQTVSAKLSWSHYILLLGISEYRARVFYTKQTLQENWSVRELEKQINASYYERYTLSRNKGKTLLKKQKSNQKITQSDVIKDPYVLDFLKINHTNISEKLLEQKIIDNLQLFLLELGKGFTFVGRQYKISIKNKHFYIDLVFYHRILKCFVLIDLKTKPVRHSDIGQMNLYLNYFAAEENVINDNKPIGIILSTDKDEILVEYAMGGLTNKIFVSKYQLYLPDKATLQRQVKGLLNKKKPTNAKAQ